MYSCLTSRRKRTVAHEGTTNQAIIFLETQNPAATEDNTMKIALVTVSLAALFVAPATAGRTTVRVSCSSAS